MTTTTRISEIEARYNRFGTQPWEGATVMHEDIAFLLSALRSARADALEEAAIAVELKASIASHRAMAERNRPTIDQRDEDDACKRALSFDQEKITLKSAVDAIRSLIPKTSSQSAEEKVK